MSRPRANALPAESNHWGGENSDKILENAVIKRRLKRLLGTRNYAAFLESFETLNPIERKGNVLFSSGCLLHACTHLESAIVIDLVNHTIHAAIYNEATKTRYFNETGRKTPEAIIKWAARLRRLKARRSRKASPANKSDNATQIKEAGR